MGFTWVGLFGVSRGWSLLWTGLKSAGGACSGMGTLCGRGLSLWSSGGRNFSKGGRSFWLKKSLVAGLAWDCQTCRWWAGQGRAGLHTHNMKSCSQLGWLPRTAMVVLFTFCTFSVTYVLNFSAAEEWGSGPMSPSRFVSSPQPLRTDQRARVPELLVIIHSYNYTAEIEASLKDLLFSWGN